MTATPKPAITPSKGEYRRYSSRSLCRRCPPQLGREAQGTHAPFEFCENCRVAFFHKRKELRREGRELTPEEFLREFPSKLSRELCHRCPKELGRPAYDSGLCRSCSNAWTNYKSTLRNKDPDAKLPTAQEFIDRRPKRVVKVGGRYLVLVPRSTI